ncbi:hypothetical protein [Arenimonas fontis]|uniref:Uncharacterized protein n=1 Tax=Arenimonas fontis TaxID=2608255 RepID=A0A5B2ZEH0_9GAMM|nr:hypothetical protein [Arenimonas fontis]KAA2285421.1 hypothetical protein F0415_05770 [Arenimonas fontis]
MPNVKISDLDDAAPLADADLAELEQPGEAAGTRSRKVALAILRAYALTSPVNAQSGTSYTLALSDAFRLVTMDNAAANTLIVPKNSVVAFPVGTRIDLGQDGSGQTTIAPVDGDVTIRTPETLKLRKRWAKATLIKRAVDTWDLEGNLEAAP